MKITSSAAFVGEQTGQHGRVNACRPIDEYTVSVHRDGLPDLQVVAVTKELLDEQDVEEILTAYPQADGIVNTGRNTHYSGTAKQRVRDRGAALHSLGEYLGALNKADFRGHEDSTVRYGLEAFAHHSRVESVEQICETRIRLHRRDGVGPIDFVPTSIYTLGVAQLEDLLRRHPGVHAVVNFGSWTQYTPEAKARAEEGGVGLFTTREMFGALNLDGGSFVRYRAR